MQDVRYRCFQVYTNVLLVIVCASAAEAQRPTIGQRGIVNSASFARPLQVSSGGLFTIFGRDLASGVHQPQSVPLPTELGGTTVLVDGVPAPLLYVSPGQINFQVPSQRGREPRRILVRTAGGTSDPVTATAEINWEGLFVQGSNACGLGAIQNVEIDGRTTLNGPGQSVSPGGYISIFGTGLGSDTHVPVADGVPAPVGEPLPRYISSVGVLLGLEGFHRRGTNVLYAGRAPTLIGVDQIVVQIPEDAPEGCEVPLRLNSSLSASQPVTVSVRKGGGRCENPPSASTGVLRWQKTFVSGPESAARTEQETFSASLIRAAENLLAPEQHLIKEGNCGSLPTLPDISTGMHCTVSGVPLLDAGVLNLIGANGSRITVGATQRGSLDQYQTTLPSGSIQPGQVRVATGGGPTVGAFDTALTVPPPIQITTSLTPGTIISSTRPFRLTWTNGRDDAVVRIRLQNAQCAASTASGQITMNVVGPDNFIPGIIESENAELIVTVSPRNADTAVFSALGLTQGGKHQWTYEYRFRGLRIR
jgi:uncharacterized protein (TIGR03437 family)